MQHVGMEFKVLILFSLLLLTILQAQIIEELGSCDPLVPQNCLLPFPNNFWTEANENTETGLNLRFAADTFPTTRTGEGIDPAQWNKLDGFSPTPAIMSYFEDVSLENVPSHKNIERSLLPDCPTILLDTETLSIVPHWAELDESTPNTQDRAFMMWPAMRLVSGRRYIVGIRGLVSTVTGLVIPPSEAFVSLLNGDSTDPAIYLRIIYYQTNVFPLLQAIGVDLNSLQLAWDFTVGSQQSITSQLINMRDDGLSRLPVTGPKYYITKVTENPYPTIARQIKADFEVPLYTDKKGPGCHLVLNSQGVPVFQEWVNASFTLNIPNSLVIEGRKGITLQYGHGLFGDQDEVNNENLCQVADTYGYIPVATDWWGLCTTDVVAVTGMVTNNLTDCSIIPDRSLQGILNFLVLSRLLISDTFAADPNFVFNGISVFSPSDLQYNGNSLGGIYGTTFLSVSQDILKGSISVPGAPFALALPRSTAFTTYFDIIKLRYPNAFDRINVINIMQLLWDRSDPSGFMSYTTSNTLPNTPPKQIMIQYALGDGLVPWLAALTLGRSLEASMFPENVREDDEILFGFNTVSSGFSGSIIQGYDYGVPSVPQTNIPPSEYNTHSCCRQDPRVMNSMYSLFTTGLISNFCDGPCSPPNPPLSDPKCQPVTFLSLLFDSSNRHPSYLPRQSSKLTLSHMRKLTPSL